MSTRTIVSLDIGTVNLSYCIFALHGEGSPPTIVDWRRLYLCADEPPKTCDRCKKRANWRTPDGHTPVGHWCKTHVDRTPAPLIVPVPLGAINALKIDKLREMAHAYGLPTDGRRDVILRAIKAHRKTIELVPIRIPNGTKVSLNVVGEQIAMKFGTAFAQVPHVDLCLVENQIGPRASRMKSIQSLATQWIKIKYPSMQIRNTSATNKLVEAEAGQKSTYAQRKKLAVKLATAEIERDFPEWSHTMMLGEKNDDLADSFLQGLWYIRTL